MEWNEETARRLERQAERFERVDRVTFSPIDVALDIRSALAEIQRQDQRIAELERLLVAKEVESGIRGDAGREYRERAEKAEARVVELEQRKPCIRPGCNDDARAIYAVCYKHRNEPHWADAENEALRAEVQQTKAHYTAARERQASLLTELEALRAERDRLREALKGLLFLWELHHKATPETMPLQQRIARAALAAQGSASEEKGEHKKHPSGDYCSFCLAQWPCEEAIGEEEKANRG